MTSPKAMTNARPRKTGGMYLDDDIQVGKHGLTPETVYDVAVVASRDAESGEEGGTSAVRRKELAVKAGEAKQRKLNVVCLVLGMIGLVLSIVVAEMLFDNQDEATPVIDGLKACITVTTALLLVFLVIRTNSLLKLYKLRGGMDEDETLRTSGLITPLMLELVLCVVHAPPGVSFSISVTNMGGPVTYSVDAFVSLWQLMRLYLIVSVFNDMVGFRTAQARVIAKWNNVSFDAAFAFKALMERAPLSLLGFVMLSLIFVLGYCLRVLERPLCAPFLPPHSLCDQVFVRTDANSLANMFWFVIITMTVRRDLAGCGCCVAARSCACVWFVPWCQVVVVGCTCLACRGVCTTFSHTCGAACPRSCTDGWLRRHVPPHLRGSSRGRHHLSRRCRRHRVAGDRHHLHEHLPPR